MNETIHFLWAIVAIVAIVAGSILYYHLNQSPEERAFSRCTVSGSAMVESAARIACAKAIFGTEEIQ